MPHGFHFSALDTSRVYLLICCICLFSRWTFISRSSRFWISFATRTTPRHGFTRFCTRWDFRSPTPPLLLVHARNSLRHSLDWFLSPFVRTHHLAFLHSWTFSFHNAALACTSPHRIAVWFLSFCGLRIFPTCISRFSGRRWTHI